MRLVSYPSTYQLGHRALVDLFKEPVLVEEKIDGSQFSFGTVWLPAQAAVPEIARIGTRGEEVLALVCRSKGADLNLAAPEKLFGQAVATAQRLAPQLHPGWTYRAEYLAKPKHNALAYDRIPTNHLILFDIDQGLEDYLPYEAKAEEAHRLGLEVVPQLFQGTVEGLDHFRVLLETVSVLGGQKVEGVVIKNYARFGPDQKVLIGKFVSEAFKEVHAAEWKMANPAAGDIVDRLIRQYQTPARWAKAVQHLQESGALVGEPKDIGLLMKAVPEDIANEATDEIREVLWQWAWPKVRRGVVAGLPELYKEQLFRMQFSQGEDAPGLVPVQVGGGNRPIGLGGILTPSSPEFGGPNVEVESGAVPVGIDPNALEDRTPFGPEPKVQQRDPRG